MKRVFFSLLGAALFLGGNALARDVKTIDGEVYKNISIRARDATGIQIMHDDGVIFLDFKNLSEADQKEFGYDPATYADGWKAKFETEKKRREQAEIAAQQANARAQAAQAQAQASASTQETYQPTNQTGLQVTVDSPGFIYGGYPVYGFSAGVPVNYFGTTAVPCPGFQYRGFNRGASWGPVQIRRR